MQHRKQDQVTVKMKLVLEGDGTVKGHADIESKGLYGLFARSMMMTIPQGVEAQVAGQSGLKVVEIII